MYAYVKNSPLNYVDPSGHWYEFGRSVDSRQETAGSFTGTTVSSSGYSQQKNTGKAGGSFRESAKELIDGLKALMEKVVYRKSISECREEAEEKGRPFIPNMLEQQKDGIVGIAYALVRNLGFGTAEILTWLAGRNDLKDYLKDKKGDLESWLLENYVYDPVYFHFGELIGDALGIYYSAKGVEKVLKEAKSVVSMLGSFLSKIGTGGSISMSGDAAVLSGKAGLELEIILELLGEAGVALAGVIKEVAVGIVAASGIPGDGEKFLHELRKSLEGESETKGKYEVSDSRREHILEGDPPGTGHGPNRGNSEGAFPDTWTDDQVIDAIERVANNPNSTWKQATGKGANTAPITTGGPDPNTPLTTNKGGPVRFKVQGQDHGLNIEVIVEPNGEGIITGYVLGD